MPYRGGDRSRPPCYRHAAADASETCAGCLQPICEICVLFESTQPHCPVCAQKVRRLRKLRRGLAGALVALVGLAFVGAVGYVVTRDKPFDYGIRTIKVSALNEQLEREPCDRTHTVELTETMVAAGDYRGALTRARAFALKCGPYDRLLWVTYTAHQRLSEYDAAVADASKLIASHPDDKDFWWWRGIVYEERGELERAAADYRHALEVEPRLTGVPFNLANVLERLDRPCEAKVPVEQYLHLHPELTDPERAQRRLDRLDAACRAQRGEARPQ
jgi:aspartyl protease family protein